MQTRFAIPLHFLSNTAGHARLGVLALEHDLDALLAVVDHARGAQALQQVRLGRAAAGGDYGAPGGRRQLHRELAGAAGGRRDEYRVAALQPPSLLQACSTVSSEMKEYFDVAPTGRSGSGAHLVQTYECVE